MVARVVGQRLRFQLAGVLAHANLDTSGHCRITTVDRKGFRGAHSRHVDQQVQATKSADASLWRLGVVGIVG